MGYSTDSITPAVVGSRTCSTSILLPSPVVNLIPSTGTGSITPAVVGSSACSTSTLLITSTGSITPAVVASSTCSTSTLLPLPVVVSVKYYYLYTSGEENTSRASTTTGSNYRY